MANLRGGPGKNGLHKQVMDGFHRLEKYGIGKHGKKDNMTYSLALGKKRLGYLKDLKNFVLNEKLTGKLNVFMSNKTLMDKFLEQRIENLSPSSQENYLRGYSSMLQGLKQANVSICIDKSYFDKKVFKLVKDRTIKTGRAISNVDKVVEKLYKIRYESGVIGQVQKELALRTSEAIELVKNHEKYITENTVSNIVGKGNHVYTDKAISNELKMKIEAVVKVPHEDTYRNDFKEVTNGEHIPHDLRFTFAKEQMEKNVAGGIAYENSLKLVSVALNHVSKERTLYYLARA